MDHVQTEADRRVAQALRDQFQGRAPIDWGQVATAAINALLAYEEELNAQVMAGMHG